MSLRRRLFLLLGGLICLLLVGQWLLFRALTRAVTEDVRTVAFRVGEEILSGFSYRTESRTESHGGGQGEATTARGEGEAGTHVVIVTTGGPAEGAEPKAPAELLPPEKEGDAPRLVMRRELHWKSPSGDPGAAAGGVAGAAEESLPPMAIAGAEPESGDLQLRRMVLETDEARDVLVVRGPAMKRRIPIPDAEIASTLDRFGSQLLLGNLALLAAGLLAAAIVAHRLTRPLASLTAAAERVGAGELGVAVDLRRAERGPPSPPSDEVGRAIAAFNQMSQRLAELDRENRRLASAEQLSELGEVARGLAHSLRNPLNALGLAIEQAGAPAEIVEGSRRQIRRMDGALRSFLALASAGSAQAETVDLVRLAREVALEALQDGAGRVRIEVDAATTRDGGRPLVVSGVPAELKAVLQALVVNAVEASPEGGSVQIRLEPGAPGGMSEKVRIRIDDEGGGLPEAVRSRLFEPHVTTKPHGSGMGLFLAQRLVSGRYAGELRLAPRAEAGTSAILDLGDRTP
jgi:signal transduction histidine kinase